MSSGKKEVINSEEEQKQDEQLGDVKMEEAKAGDGSDDEEEDIPIDVNMNDDPFYLRYYSGHQGRYGHEFLEFDLRVQDDGKCAVLRYANNSNYRNESLIKKQVTLSPTVFKQFKRIINDCEILK